MKTKFYYLMMCLCVAFGTTVLTSCGDDEEDEPTLPYWGLNNTYPYPSDNGSNNGGNDNNKPDKTAEIMEAINGHTFYQRDYGMDGRDGWDYQHYITFEKKSANSGNVAHKLDWRDIENGKTSDRGTHTCNGTFVIEDNKIKVNVSCGGLGGSEFELDGTSIHDGDYYMTRQ